MGIYVLIVCGGDRTIRLGTVHTESSKVLIYREYNAAVGSCPVFVLVQGSVSGVANSYIEQETA